MELVEIGRVILAVLGYGLAIILMLGVGQAIWDGAVASKEGVSKDGFTVRQNGVMMLRLILASTAAVLVTMFLLWLTD